MSLPIAGCNCWMCRQAACTCSYCLLKKQFPCTDPRTSTCRRADEPDDDSDVVMVIDSSDGHCSEDVEDDQDDEDHEDDCHCSEDDQDDEAEDPEETEEDDSHCSDDDEADEPEPEPEALDDEDLTSSSDSGGIDCFFFCVKGPFIVCSDCGGMRLTPVTPSTDHATCYKGLLIKCSVCKGWHPCDPAEYIEPGELVLRFPPYYRDDEL
eukprot:TRINITY_DN7587_c0_g2_i1.p1 TRINITY_DN7587_c0_g2~~TRINITY_DN7587_c0_g2_i1.p1  ORF type:complete len:209 (-),score=53.98 TRINITY_DN7587_c0_g2_i1:369-995(-)